MTFTIGEFKDGSECLDIYLQALAQKLNSNQEFIPDNSFTVETTFIHTPAPGSGNGKRYKPSSAAVPGIVKMSRIPIKNKDKLCCAWAIVTMKALIDANGNTRDHHYHNLKQGYPVQERLANELHRLAGVPEGPCGISELQKFQAALPEHQIKVLSVTPPHVLMTIRMGVTRLRDSSTNHTSVINAIRGTITMIMKIIPAMVNGVHLVIKRTAWISQRLNDRWVWANSLHPLLFAVCIIDPFPVKTVTLTIFIVVVKIFLLSVTLCLECCKTYEAKPRKRSHRGDRKSSDHICGLGLVPHL